MTQPLKLLFILPEFHPTTGGGICTYYKELLKENQKQRAWDVTVLQGSAVETRGGQAIWEGINIHYLTLELLHKYKKLFNHFSVLPELQNHVASSWAMYELAQQLPQTFDAVITTDWGFGFVPWIIKQQLPVIIHLHGSVGQIDFYDPRPGYDLWTSYYLQIETTLLSYANALITHSNQNIRFWNERLFKPGAIMLIPPAVVKPSHSFIGTTAESNKNTGLVVGRIQNWKGVIQLCEAINLLPKEKQRILTIYWIGRDTFYSTSGTNMSDYLAATYPHIWNKIVVPVGPKEHEEIEQYYQKAAWSLVPSTWDMFNLCAVEHLLHKKPLICSTGAGASDILTHDSIALFNNTPEELAIELEKILELDACELKKRGEEGHAFALEKFNPGIVHVKHTALLEAVINDFVVEENLENKFGWLLPKEENGQHNPKEVLLSNWALKEVVHLFVKRVKEKIKI